MATLPVPSAALIILDGWGLAPPGPGNAVSLANTPNFDRLWQQYPTTQLSAQGPDVGLPEGQMGNSEVGHLNLGAGAIVKQDLARIDTAVANGEFFDNEALVDACQRAVNGNGRLHLTVAINYGGRDEILRATRRVAEAVRIGKLRADEIGPATIEAHLDTAGLPDPDLVLRTSGEYRVSGFLPWQSAYAEFAFVDTRWPDFTAEMFAVQVQGFGRRERRFGAVAR